MENTMIILEEYRILAVNGKLVIELESGYLSLPDAESSIPYWKEQYPNYKIIIEKY